MRANIMGGEPGDMLFEDLEGLLREINGKKNTIQLLKTN
jgi:hypothetical protein